ncbi:MAG: hypothetical protein H6838_16670 [Planctomycetes bacterium]|nr:hypothetical protein [Planctomycetota bacterium]
MILVVASALGLIGTPLPLPLPPLPEDPALLRAAPAETMLYAQWFGAGTPAANPTNRSERLAAEPEVRAMLVKLLGAMRGVYEMAAARATEASHALTIYDLLTDALQRPGCAFVVDLQPLAGGVAVRFGDDAGPVAAKFAQALAALAPKIAAKKTVTVDGIEFAGLTVGEEGPFFGSAAVDGYFAFAIGEKVARQLVAGLRNQDQGLAGNGTLQQLRDGAKVERPVLRTWAAPDKLAAKAPAANRFWGPLGLSRATAALAESGLEGDGFVSRVQLAIPKPSGLLGELRGATLSQDDLVLIPKDATMALAMRGGEGSFENLLLGVMGALTGQEPGGDWQQFLTQLQSRTGVQLRDDLLANAGDCVVAWSAPSQGGVGFTGAVAAVPLRDGEKFGEHLSAMWEKMVGIAPNKATDREAKRAISHRAYLEQFGHGGSKVWWVDLIDRDLPFAFSWTATANHFLFGLLPQPVRSAIDDSREPNFDQALARTPLIARRGAANAMLYLDLRGLLQQGYGAGLMTLEIASYEWQREGFDFDLADVPRLGALLPHLGPELTVLETTPGGCRLVRRGSLPVFDALLISCAAACLMAVD